jgi:threonine dehydratase
VVIQSNANCFRVDAARAEVAEVIMKAPGGIIRRARAFIQMEAVFSFVHSRGQSATIGEQQVSARIDGGHPVWMLSSVSIGGGGLIVALPLVVKQMNPDCKVYGLNLWARACINLSKRGRSVID